MTLVYGNTRKLTPDAAERKIAELEAALRGQQPTQTGVPEHVRLAMAVVTSMQQGQPLYPHVYGYRRHVGIITRELHPCEEAMFSAACDSISDYLDANNKSVRAYISKGTRKRVKK